MMYVRPEFVVLLLAGFGFWALLLGIVVAFLFGVIQWRWDSRFWMFPALILAASAAATHWVAVPVGRIISDRELRLHLDEYNAVVQAVAAGSVPGEVVVAGTAPDPADCRTWAFPASQRKLPHRIAAIWAKRCSEEMAVEFLVETDVPTLHEGYLFRGHTDQGSSSYAELPTSSRWAYTRRIAGAWYRFADQPGF
jgi:hypothetical protein